MPSTSHELPRPTPPLSAATLAQRATVLTVAAALAATALLTGTMSPASAAPTNTSTGLVIDAASVVRPVTHVGSGGLYALATATTPDVSSLLPLHLNQLTQPAPGVQQLGNGATVPTGDALVVSGSATSSGAQQTVRMPDIYPNFPYGWVSWDDWLSKVDTMVKARMDATDTTNINGWELWNEPNWTWPTAAAGPFNDGWTRTYNEVRSLDSVTPIVGPSIDRWDADYMRDFLTAAKAAGTLPDVVSWHELVNGWADIPAHVAEYRSIESSLGISPRPISINEYAWTDQVDVPSSALHYISQFERAGVRDAERAYWYESGTVNGLLHDGRPTGTYWLYDWYGSQTGNIVSVTPSGDQDGVASFDSTRKIVDAVVGGAAGSNSVTVTGLDGFGPNAQVSLDYTPSSGRKSNVDAPTHLWTRSLPVAGGSITVPISGQDANGAYHVVVTPASGPVGTYQQRYEAENATVVNGVRESSTDASNGGYVDGLDNAGDARSDSFVDFAVDAPVTGDYDISLRYANADGSAATQGFRLDGGDWRTLDLAPTGGSTDFADHGVGTMHLEAGRHVFRLAKGTPGFDGGVGSAALDYLSVVSKTAVPAPAPLPDAPVATFVTRAEAESGTIAGGTTYPSDKASGGQFVGGLDSADSAVTTTVTVPVAGTYTLAVGYANGGGFNQNGTSDAVLALSINGATSTDERFPTTGPWGVPGGTFPAKSFPVTLNAGANTIRLQHEAGQNYAELDYVQVSSPAGAFVDGRATQTITFPAVGDLEVGAADVSLAATSSSGLAVTYATSGNCTVVNGALHATTVGSCTVTAGQAGDYTTAPAPDVVQTVNVVGNNQAVPTLTGVAGSQGWYTSKVIVALTSPTSGAKVQYRVDGGSWRSYSAPFTVAKDGMHTVATRLLQDSVVVSGSATSFTLGVDATAPTGQATVDPRGTGSPRNPVTVTVTGRDTASGTDSVSYRINDGAWIPATAPLVMSTVGNYVVSYQATDKAGNRSAVKSVAVNIHADPTTSVAVTSSVNAGSFATYQISGFHRYSQVTLQLGGTTLATVTTDVNGRATVTARVPASTPGGTYQVTASDGQLSARATQKVRVIS